MDMNDFSVSHVEGKSRVGLLKTSRGDVETPLNDAFDLSAHLEDNFILFSAIFFSSHSKYKAAK